MSISGAITLIVFVMLSLGNGAGCWRCVLDHVVMGRIWILGLFSHQIWNKGSVFPGFLGCWSCQTMCQNNVMRFISKEKIRRNCISSLRAIDFIAPLSFFVHLRLYLHPQICLHGLRQGAIYLHLQHFLSFSTFCWCNKSSVVSGDPCLWCVCPQFALENRLRSSTINFPERGPVFVT